MFQENMQFSRVLFVGGNIPESEVSASIGLKIPSKLLISSGVINFVTPAANFCDHLPCLFHQILKKFKNKLLFNKQYF